ncbi:MAG: DNA polymerase III subunit gamma/tau [Gemmataceae bacterium]
MAKAKPNPDALDPVVSRPAGYTVVARRYRPQQFADLIGQEHVAAALTNALTSGRIAHAYLFTGARGTGKTSTARILAKALNCVTGPTPTPCDKCDICKSIADGDDVDVLEIDGATNRKIDDVRELRQNVGFRPQRARYKVYIIDEVHMLTTESFNALLKTLEEPPPHIKFIFATTEVQKLPITILSRCQRFDFASIGPAKVFATLQHIVKKEGLQADDDALQIIARRAAGSMRDGQTLLDQLLGSTDGRLTAAAVHALLGTAGDDRIADLATAILGKDAKRAVELVAEAADQGLQLGEVLDQLVGYWRGLMLVKVAGDAAPDLPGTPALHEQIRKHAAVLTLDTVLAGLDVLTTAKAKLRGSPHVQVMVEVAVVRLSRMEELLTVSALVQLLAGDGTGGGRKPPFGPPSDGPQPGASAPRSSVDPSKKNSLTAPNANGNGTHAPPSDGPVEVTAQNWPSVWDRVRQQLGPVQRSALELAGLPATSGPNSLAIHFPADYGSAYDAVASEAGTDAIRRSLKQVTGRDWSVRVDRRPANPAGMPAGGSGLAPTPRPDRRKALLDLPLFKRAADALGAQLVRVEDGFDPLATPQAVGPAGPAPDPDPDEV